MILNEVIMVSVILFYIYGGGILDVREFYLLIIKFGFKGFVFVLINLLYMYCICFSLGEVRKLFSEMSEKNLVFWNVMLNGYSKMGFVDLVRDLFDKIFEKDVVLWGTIIDVYVRIDRLVEVLLLYRDMFRLRLGFNDVMIVDLVFGCGRVLVVNEG